MKFPALRRIVVAVFLAIPAICGGCNRHVAGGSPANIAKPSPEERFQRILDSFRRKVEGQPVSFVVIEGGSRSTMFGTNKVSSRLIRPATAEDHYKAVVTVASESHYSLRRSKSATDESDRDQNAKSQGTNPLTDSSDKKGIAILEPDLAGTPSNKSDAASSKPKQSDEDFVTRQKDQEERNYELVYDGDRWVLVTKLNPKTEQSIQFAFDEALARQ